MTFFTNLVEPNQKDYTYTLTYKYTKGQEVMKVYTSKSINEYDVSLVKKFFNDGAIPEIHNYTERVQENCLLFLYVIDLLTIPETVKERLKYIKNKKIVLIYHHKNLGVPNYVQLITLREINDRLVNLNFEKHQVYFICQSKGDIPLIKEKLGNINVLHFCKWLDEFADNQIMTYLKRFPGRNINIFPKTERKKLSICIRRFDQDRLDFMSKLVDENLIDEFNFTFTNHLGINCRETISLDTVKTMVSDNLKDKGKVIDWVDKMPYLHGNDIEFPYPLELDSLMVNSFVNVAFETSPKDDCCVISEKVYKPIFLMKPFIVVSQPYALKLIKDSGFHTFNNFIDESYDTIENYDERINAIITEVKRLQNLSFQDIDMLEHEMIDIFVHNFHLLISEAFKPFPANFTYKGMMYD